MLSNMIQYHVCIAGPCKRYNRSPTEMLSEVLDLTGTGSRQISTSDNSSTGHSPPETFIFGPGWFYSHPASTLPVPTLPQKLLETSRKPRPRNTTRSSPSLLLRHIITPVGVLPAFRKGIGEFCIQGSKLRETELCFRAPVSDSDEIQ